MIEVALIVWLVLAQMLAAMWWWVGPSLPGTRGAGVSLFSLNAAAMLSGLVAQAGCGDACALLSTSFDRLTNVSLLVLAVAAAFGPPAVGRTTVIAGAIQLAALGLELSGSTVVNAWVSSLVFECVLLAAIVATSLAMRRVSARDGHSLAWLLILAVIAARFADLAFGWAHGMWVNGVFADPVGAIPHLAAIVSVLLVAVTLAGRALDPRRDAHRVWLYAGFALIAAGAWMGFVRTWAVTPSSVVFSMAAPRPFVFIAASVFLATASGRPVETRLRTATAWVVIAAAGVVGLALSDFLWSVPAPIAFGFAISFALLAWPLTRIFGLRPVLGTGGQMPPAWTRAQENFARLDERTREDLRTLARWERLVLALDLAPGSLRDPSVHRTPLGLHVTTQCPLRVMAQEVNRANDRAARILADLGLPGVAPSAGLVSSSWGAVRGLKSRRVRIYDLTPQGQAVARALWSRLAIPLEGEDLRLVLGEALGSPEKALLQSRSVQRFVEATEA